LYVLSFLHFFFGGRLFFLSVLSVFRS
jgi:hypothetical protein